LDEEGAELGPKAAHFRQEVLQQVACSFESTLVGDGFGDLHGKPEPFRN